MDLREKEITNPSSLIFHLERVFSGERRFENAFEGVSRMIVSGGLKEDTVRGKNITDYGIFREGQKHVIGIHEEINSFVGYVRDAAQGGSSKEMAFVLVGEPGNGKTFLVEHICKKYREFLSLPENNKFSFMFSNLKQIGGFGNIEYVESQTYEDPVILIMNFFSDTEKNKEFLSQIASRVGVKKTGKVVEDLYKNYRPLGACSAYIWRKIRECAEEKPEEMLKFINLIPVPLEESLGTVTGKYSAKDKITSSAVDLLGEESIIRLLHIVDPNNPYRFDLRRGALARVAGGGIHFADELFKNKTDLVQVYLGVIQNRNIELDGYKWPIDTLIIATSNNEEYNRFKSAKEEAPIDDRCRKCYIPHNTDFKLQEELTSYAIGGNKISLTGKPLHQDPNLIYASSVGVVLSRLPKSEKLTPVETMKLAAGEVAGEKSIKTLTEVIETLAQSSDITKRWGQKGLGQRDLGRALQILIEMPETEKGQCMFALDIFKALESLIYDMDDVFYREKYLSDLVMAKILYKERIKTEMFNAYMDEPEAIQKDVMNYVNMIIGIDADNLGPDKMWKYKDPQTGEMKALKIDERFIKSVEEGLGLKTEEQRRAFRTTIRRIYGQKMSTDKNYDFMDNVDLVKAVTDVRLESDITGAGSLMGALANRTNEENQKLYERMVKTMIKKLKYCKTCAQKTIEYFCTKDDEA